MQTPFVKMQAQGNDFVILNGIDDTLPELTQSFIQHICNRHLGIGCDQLLILQPSKQADALMLIYNTDGSQAANCGNGLRCVGDLLLRKLDKDEVSIALADRVVEAKRTNLGIQVGMGHAEIEQVTGDYVDVLIGNAHRVYFQNSVACPERNVETIHKYDEQHAEISIVERGAGETLACGSGACATAVAVWSKVSRPHPLTIHMPGGEAVVHQHNDECVLEGVVSTVFQGVFNCTDTAVRI